MLPWIFPFEKTLHSPINYCVLLVKPENNVGLGGCLIMECFLPYLSMVTVPHTMVGLERMLDYKGVGLERFH